MPQGSSAAPGRFVKVIIKVPDHVAVYLDDVIVFDADPSLHVANMKAFLLRLRKHNLKLSPSKATVDATDADWSHHLPRRHHAKHPKRRSADENSHAGRPETATLPLQRSFLLQEISLRYAQADTAHHLSSETRRQVRSHFGHGSHRAGTCRRVVYASGPYPN